MSSDNEKKTNRGRGNSRNKTKVDPWSLSGGKIPPQANDVEKDIIGAMMINRDCFETVMELLTPDVFYVDAYQRLFRSCERLALASSPVDLHTVVEDLMKHAELELIGGPTAIVEVTKGVPGDAIAKIERYCGIVLEKYFKREIIKISAEALTDAFDDTVDVFDLHDELEGRISSVTAKHTRGTHIETPKLAIAAKERIEYLRNNKGMLTGVPTGFRPVDRVTNGWQPTDLIILAARPSVGKTAFALNLARNAINHFQKRWMAEGKQGKPKGVGFFSLEMSGGQLINRLIASEGEIDLEKISNGRFTSEAEYEYFKVVADKVGDMPIFIDDTPALRLMEFRSRARRMVTRRNVGLIIVDYLQLMRGSGNEYNREAEISSISRTLKEMAKELNVPIIALSQMNRAQDKEKRDPQLSDLRESGAIEQDADLVAFLTRPDYQKKEGEVDHTMKHDIKLWIKKHRNGKLENILLKAVLSIQRVFDLEDFDTYQENRKEGTPVIYTANSSFSLEDELTDDLPF